LTEKEELRDDADGFEDFGKDPEDLRMLAFSASRRAAKYYLEKGIVPEDSILDDEVPERGDDNAA
jgi:hypothetical protein